MNSLSILQHYDYPLSKERIANQAAEPRDHSRLLLFNRQSGQTADYYFYQLADLLSANDVLVLNESKVFPARLLGKKASGGKVELLLLRQLDERHWQALAKPGLKLQQRLFFLRPEQLANEDLDLADALENCLQARVLERSVNSAEVVVEFNLAGDSLWQEIEACGLTPLPPYIHPSQPESQLQARYQTVYAKTRGSAAAPTAGLHFTPELLVKLQARGIAIEKITLHVGLGTFAKLTTDNIREKKLHREYYEIDENTVTRLNQAKAAGKRIITVGTTTLRTLESAVLRSADKRQLVAGARETALFILPPYRFNFADALITNFHLPQSSLLMLVAAFCSAPNSPHHFHDFLSSALGKAYLEAIANDYRFFSFGDAMLIQD